MRFSCSQTSCRSNKTFSKARWWFYIPKTVRLSCRIWIIRFSCSCSWNCILECRSSACRTFKPNFIQQLRRNFINKSWWIVIFVFAPHLTAFCRCKIKFFFRTSNSNIHQATFFFHFWWDIKCSLMRKYTFITTGKKYYWELQTFCRVQSHQGYIIWDIFHSVKVRNQSNLLQKFT